MPKHALISIKKILQETQDFKTALSNIYETMQALFKVQEIRLYHKKSRKPQIEADIANQNIVLPLSTSSIAGFTALTQIPLIIRNTANKKELSAISENLNYNPSYDKLAEVQAKSLISLPLRYKSALLGVLQLVNKQNGHIFSREDEAIARMVADIMAKKLHSERRLTSGPFEHLVFKSIISSQQLQAAKNKAKKNNTWVSRVLRNDFKVKADDIGNSLERYYQVPFMRYNQNLCLPKLQGFSIQYLRTNLWVPVAMQNKHCVVLIYDPSSNALRQDIQSVINAQSYEFRVGLPEEILAYLGDKRYLPEDDYNTITGLHDLLQEAESGPEEIEESEVEDLIDAFDDVPSEDMDFSTADSGSLFEGEDISQESRELAVRYVNQIIMHAHKIGASDIHIEPSKGSTPAAVRMRIDGICRQVLKIPAKDIRAVASRIKIISGLNIAERRKPQDGKAKVKFKGRELELRIATVPTVHGESVVLRMLASGKPMSFKKLNLTEHNQQLLREILAKPHGIFLVVGPTGSGKTTTLHSILAQINTPERKIWTVEDPVEITQPGLQQVEVSPSIGLDFASVMRSFLRADPDVILVGEMRDYETAHIGVEASLTGHLVFSTLHTNSATETVTRLLELGIDPFNFCDALLGILAQRLIRTLCPNCKKAYSPAKQELAELKEFYGSEDIPGLNQDTQFYAAAGCERCGGTGYKGRTGIHELLTMSADVRKCILEKKSAHKLKKVGLQNRMLTLMQDGIGKIIKGDIDLKQLRRSVS